MPRKIQPGSSSRPQLNMRITPEFRERLEESARRSGRTLTAEAEHLIAVGMGGGEGESLGAPHTKVLLHAFATAIDTVEKMLDKSWKDDPEARAAVYLAVDCLLRFTIGMDATERAKFNRKNHGLGAQVAQVWLGSLGYSQAEFERRVSDHPAGPRTEMKSEARKAPGDRWSGTILSDLDAIVAGTDSQSASPSTDSDQGERPASNEAEAEKPQRKRTRK